MKNVIVLGVVAVVLFSVSAGLSLFLNTQKTEETKTPEKEKKAKVEPEASSPLVRPQVNPSAQDADKLAQELRDQLARMKERESKVEIRQKQIDLILMDIRSDREILDRLRNQIATELKLVSEKSGELDKKFAELDTERKQVAKSTSELGKGRVEIEKDERTNLVKMASLYDAMAPENAAKILQQMADTGKMDTAVKVLAAMKPAKASKVLSEMPDSSLAAQLLEKMKSLKPAPGTTPEG